MNFRVLTFSFLFFGLALGAQVFQRVKLPALSQPATILRKGPPAAPYKKLELRALGRQWSSPPLNTYVPLDRMSTCLIRALLWQEDQTFRRHRGYSLREMGQVAIEQLRGNRLRGASTITQQLARTLFLNREHSARRKIMELRIAILLESEFSKTELLELYLNYVYWGRNRRGAPAAARLHFSRGAGQLGPEQCAFLIGLLPNPDGCRRLGANCRNSSIKWRARRLTRLLKLNREP